MGLHPLRLHAPVMGDLKSGKRPVQAGWQHLPLDLDLLCGELAQYPASNLGLRMGRQADGRCLVALDIDDLVAFQVRADQLGALPATFATKTGKGFHGVFLVDADVLARLTNFTKRDGIDARVQGGQIAVPPSLHPSGVHYQSMHTPMLAPARLTQPWVDWLLACSAPRVHVAPADCDCPADLVRDDRWRAEATAHARNLPVAVAGAGGSALFTAASVLMRGWLLTRDGADAVLRAVWNPRCQPPWDFADQEHVRNWEHQLDDAESRGFTEWGSCRPMVGLDRHADAPGAALAPAAAVDPGATTWTLLDGTLLGAPQTVERALRSYRAQVRTPDTRPELASSAAVVKWLVSAKGWDPARVAAEIGPEAVQVAVRLTQPEVQTVGRLTRIDQALEAHDLRWNEMALTVEIDGQPWTDNHTAEVRLLLEQTGASDPEKPTPNGDIEQRSRAVATAYHPVQEYLGTLPAWDGVPRVDRLWPGYFKADDNDLNRKLSACFAIGAVRRVFQPGCKVDMMPILLGEQGDFKSSGLEALVGAPPFFTDAAPGFGHRSENAMTLAGCWVWEIAEMQGMDRADLNAVKAFVTRSSDDVLLPYARAKTRLQRRSTLIGTTNEDVCLTDQTGSRRHPVLRIGAIDLTSIRTDRDQLWAEALHRCSAGEPHWLAKADEAAMGERNKSDHTYRDEHVIAGLVEWFERPALQRVQGGGPDFTVNDAINGAFNGRLDGNPARRIGMALKYLGVGHRRVGYAKVFRYQFPS